MKPSPIRGGAAPSLWRRVRSPVAAVALAASAVVGVVSPAAAHPNVYIEARLRFGLEAGKIVRIDEAWTFDKKFSRVLIADYDRNRDGRFDATESRTIAKRTLPNLKPYDYFTHIWVDGRKLGLISPTNFVAVVRNKQVTFTFSAALPTPVDPRRQKLKVEIYDRTYFAQVDFAKHKPVRFQGAGDLVCKVDIRQDKEHPYWGYIYPPAVTPSCK